MTKFYVVGEAIQTIEAKKNFVGRKKSRPLDKQIILKEGFKDNKIEYLFDNARDAMIFAESRGVESTISHMEMHAPIVTVDMDLDLSNLNKTAQVVFFQNPARHDSSYRAGTKIFYYATNMEINDQIKLIQIDFHKFAKVSAINLEATRYSCLPKISHQ